MKINDIYLSNTEIKLKNLHVFLQKRILKFDLIWLGFIFPRVFQKWIPPSKCTSHMTHKKCVARHACDIFIWWPYLTTWPWTLLNLRPILLYYLLHPLGTLLTEFGFAAVISPVSLADKVKSDDLYGLNLAWLMTFRFFQIPLKNIRW